MRIVTVLTFAALLAALILCAYAWRAICSSRPRLTVSSQGPTVERLERLAQLVSMKVYVADVLTGTGEGCKGAWLIGGDGLIGVDLTRARITEKDEVARRATIILPQPTVLQSRVDHTRTKTWEVKRTTWVPWSGDQDLLRDQVMVRAQELVAHAAASEENFARARATTEALVKAFYAEVGWQISVTWEPAKGAATGPAKKRATICRLFSDCRPRDFTAP